MRIASCLLVLVLLAACDRSQSSVERARELQVGTHSIALVWPQGWEHFDYGERHHFRRDFERISIEDFNSMNAGLDEAAKRVMTRLREDERRIVASRRYFEIDGRDAVEIDTWDRLSHQYRKRFVFVDNRGTILGMYMMLGKFEAMEAAFGGLLASLTFNDSLVLAE